MSFQPEPAPRAPELATLTDDDLVTGEAVALDLPAASLGSRIVSGLIDVIVTGLVLVVVVLLLLPVAFTTDAALTWVAVIGTMISVFLVLPTTLETMTRGKSLGKMAMGLRVTGEAGQRISFARATGRYFAQILSALPLLVGYIWAAFDSRKQTWHDKLADTLVVKRR